MLEKVSPNLTSNIVEAPLTFANNTSSFQLGYYDLDFRIASIVTVGTIASVGIVGNLMVIAVVLTVRGMMSPTNCYLVSLAIADCLFFISSTPRDISSMILPMNVYVFGRIGCPVLTFLPYLCINSSSMSIAAFTVERYIAICHPMKAQYICTVKRAKVIILFIWCFSILYNSSWLFVVEVKEITGHPESVQCTYTFDRNKYKLIFIADMLLFYWIPMFLYFVLYGKIVAVLVRDKFLDEKCKRNMRKMSVDRTLLTVYYDGGGGGVVHGSSDTSVTPTPKASDVRQPFRQSEYKSGNVVNRSRIQVVKMLVVIVCVFALCWLPYRGLVVYNSFAVQIWMNPWYVLFAKVMVNVNCAINPLLYNVMSAKFRRAFKLMFRKIGLSCGYTHLYSSSRVSSKAAPNVQTLNANGAIRSARNSPLLGREKQVETKLIISNIKGHSNDSHRNSSDDT